MHAITAINPMSNPTAVESEPEAGAAHERENMHAARAYLPRSSDP
jgi:hypothetical protein